MASVIFGSVARSRTEVLRRTQQAARAFHDHGIGIGDTVALLLRNDFAFLEASVGAGMLGAYTTPLNWHSTVGEIGHLLNDAGARILVAHADLIRPIRHQLPADIEIIEVTPSEDLVQDYRIAPVSEDAGCTNWEVWLDQAEPWTEPALPSPGAMVYTSGTTGKPKGVKRDAPSAEQAGSSLQMFLTLTGMGPYVGDTDAVTALIPGPLYHSSPNAWLTALFGLGANLVIQTRFSPERWLEDVESHRVTHSIMVPTMFNRLLRLDEAVRSSADLSSLRFVMHGAAPCPVATKRAMLEWFGPIVHEHYGGTELGAITYCNAEQWLAHPGTVGRAIDGVQILVIGEDQEPVDRGAVGEIFCRNFGFPDFNYHGDPEKRRDADRDGLVTLGDLGYLDDDGFLYLAGRSSEMINSGGANIYPAEVEAELLKIPGVADAAVFGIPDADFGEAVCAHIQLIAGVELSAEEVRASLRGKLTSYKIPRAIRFSATLPREDSGKIFKRKLREPYWEGPTAHGVD